jgi:hypothetical protein
MIPARAIGGRSRGLSGGKLLGLANGSQRLGLGLGLYNFPPPAVPPLSGTLGTPILLAPKKASNTSNLTSDPFTIPADGTFFFCQSCRSSSTIVIPTLTNNSNLAFNLLASDYGYDSGAGVRCKSSLWCYINNTRAPITGVTVNTLSQPRQQHQYVFVPFAYLLPVASEIATGGHQNGDPTVNFDHVPAVNSVILGFFNASASADTPVTPCDSMTELEDIYESNGQMQGELCWRTAGSQNAQWVTTTVIATGARVEVRQPA